MHQQYRPFRGQVRSHRSTADIGVLDEPTPLGEAAIGILVEQTSVGKAAIGILIETNIRGSGLVRES